MYCDVTPCRVYLIIVAMKTSLQLPLYCYATFVAVELLNNGCHVIATKRPLLHWRTAEYRALQTPSGLSQ